MGIWDELLTEMIAKAPDPDEPLPFSNRKATIYGSTIPFLIISWVAVLFRFWVRFRVVREPGWDDVFVLLAAMCNTAATICVCFSVEHGLGQHMLYLGLENVERYLMFFYIEHSMYLTETSLIKISLLLQYLRIFKAGMMRWICVTLLVLVSIWGFGFSIAGWFSCNPIRGAYIRTLNAKCYGFGLDNVDGFVSMFIAQSSTNMAFDIAIFLTPLVLFNTPNLKWKNLVGMVGVFAFGAVAVGISVWRLCSIVVTRAATVPYMDFTWFSPVPVVLSCLEVDLAIICASMPIFWPVLQKSLSAIFVSYEVQITEDHVEDHGLAYELEHNKSERRGSVRSCSGTSTDELTKEEEGFELKGQYPMGVDPFETRGPQVNIKSQPKPEPHWEI
ncbi:hypothetical protein P153DRAFT_398518 [Dothidotthia symphoricarpi CBS 119687]|uniref:Rhodopsin domain-containing protein n=1 Tax=Dothidotthia symphoricarpi CBS 119687 TaxID=1392245 RepID=A0A6A6A582_9PLEO|nr:uncharacterized protein P153DRAFT_398518 [Dothidotthia symphoricarpi CBS 119687]KAF2127152.1 hypothetical protein P153DRAFT_398518 [Dothidotthia symphoricarpi CBS 119687]